MVGNMVLSENYIAGAFASNGQGEWTSDITVSDTDSRPPPKNIFESQEDIDKELAITNNGILESRIRLFGQNYTHVTMYRDSDCTRAGLKEGDEKVSGTLMSSLNSLIGNVSNSSIGMPETETTRYLNKKNKLLSKAYFREYVIEADQPVTINAGYEDINHVYKSNGITYSQKGGSCSRSPGYPIAVRFIPIPGADYEMDFKWRDGKCGLWINRISQKDGVTTLKPVKAYIAYACKEKE